VVVNLYPFEETLRRPGATHEDLVEKIDVGGPAMVRAAAKNHGRVAVLVDPADYPRVLQELAQHGAITHGTRCHLAAKAFAHTARYDGAISGYLSSLDEDGLRERHPRSLHVSYELAYPLRYGENPHQSGAFYVEPGAEEGTLGLAKSVGAGGKELSYNNLVDADAALECAREFAEPAAVIVKHTNPCGVAVARTLVDAYRTARDADPLSAFGGIVALNRAVDEDTARALTETFLEVVVAPSFDEAARKALHAKKNLRLLATGRFLPPGHPGRILQHLSGAMLVQERDALGGADALAARVVTRTHPAAQDLEALVFAWVVAKHTRSNAIVLAAGTDVGARTVGVGAGQMSRVVSVEIAVKKAGDLARGSVLASDAFFPFPDGVELAARAGVRAIVQPGGSVKDSEVIQCADDHGVAMVFTGVRHFRH
jgi:phosphoribosylaminoimidazolecarboxamide formyltransferase/IMP cyclohydrolase